MEKFNFNNNFNPDTIFQIYTEKKKKFIPFKL